MAKIGILANFSIFTHLEIIIRTDFENPNGKSLDLHLRLLFMLKQLFPRSQDFKEATLKILQISKHFLAMLDCI